MRVGLNVSFVGTIPYCVDKSERMFVPIPFGVFIYLFTAFGVVYGSLRCCARTGLMQNANVCILVFLKARAAMDHFFLIRRINYARVCPAAVLLLLFIKIGK